MMKKYSIETVVGVFVVIGLLCVGYMAVKLGKVSIFGDENYNLFARFSNVAGLRIGSAVDVYGIEVGTVNSLSIDPKSQMAVVGMRIRNDMTVYDDAAATIKSSGLIGDKYVKIDPGGSGEPMKSGSFIMQTSVPPDIEDLIGKYAFGDVKKEPDTSSEKQNK